MLENIINILAYLKAKAYNPTVSKFVYSTKINLSEAFINHHAKTFGTNGPHTSAFP